MDWPAGGGFSVPWVLVNITDMTMFARYKSQNLLVNMLPKLFWTPKTQQNASHPLFSWFTKWKVRRVKYSRRSGEKSRNESLQYITNWKLLATLWSSLNKEVRCVPKQISFVSSTFFNYLTWRSQSWLNTINFGTWEVVPTPEKARAHLRKSKDHRKVETFWSALFSWVSYQVIKVGNDMVSLALDMIGGPLSCHVSSCIQHSKYCNFIYTEHLTDDLTPQGQHLPQGHGKRCLETWNNEDRTKKQDNIGLR